jgi:hypothetical protein
MNEQKEYFEKLFKVKGLRQLRKVLEATDSGTVTRSEYTDLDRALNFIKYGFEEGIKFCKQKEK